MNPETAENDIPNILTSKDMEGQYATWVPVCFLRVDVFQ